MISYSNDERAGRKWEILIFRSSFQFCRYAPEKIQMDNPCSQVYPSCYFHGSFGRGGLRERRVSADVHPVVLAGRDVARPAVGRIVGGHVARGLFRQEEGPAP